MTGARVAHRSEPTRAESAARAAHRMRGAHVAHPSELSPQSLGTWCVRCAQARRPAAGGSHQQQYSAHNGAHRAPDDTADLARCDTFATAVAASRRVHVTTRAAEHDAGCTRPAVDLAARTTVRSARCAHAALDAEQGMRRDRRAGRRVHVTTRAAASRRCEPPHVHVTMRAAARQSDRATQRARAQGCDTFRSGLQRDGRKEGRIV